MTLAELTTPFQRHSIIDYKADGITVCCRRCWMQHMDGPLYKGKEHINRHGESEFNLFVVYDGIEQGLLYGRRIRHPEWYTVEKCRDGLRRCGYDTLEHYLAGMEKRIQEGRFVGNADIAFIRQFDSPLADRYARHRKEYYARREAEERRWAEAAKAAKAEKEAEQARLEAARKAERDKLHGWADGMSALRFGKAMASLHKQIRIEGAVMRRYEFVLWALQNGWMPVQREVIGPRSGKPQKEYRLQKERVFYPVTKTEFDYAVFLAGHRAEDLIAAPAGGKTEPPMCGGR